MKSRGLAASAGFSNGRSRPRSGPFRREMRPFGIGVHQTAPSRQPGPASPLLENKQTRLGAPDAALEELRTLVPSQPRYALGARSGERRTARAFRMLNVLDEFTRESLAIRLRRKLSSTDVIDVLTDLFLLRGIPAWIRSDNGPEFVAEAVRRWIAAVRAPGPLHPKRLRAISAASG